MTSARRLYTEMRRQWAELVERAQATGDYAAPSDELVAYPRTPSVDRWKIVLVGDLACLHGWVRHHPRLGPSDCWFTSTPLMRIDPDNRWAWSTNHLFSLLKPASVVQARLRKTRSPPGQDA